MIISQLKDSEKRCENDKQDEDTGLNSKAYNDNSSQRFQH